MVNDLLAFIRPPDSADTRLTNRWHWNVALTLMVFWAMAFLAFASPWKFARAGDIDDKVKAAVEPIQQQVATVGRKVDEIAADLTYTKELLIRKLTVELEREILEAKRRQCKAQTIDTVEYFRKQVIEKLDDYRSLTKREYDVPGCAEV